MAAVLLSTVVLLHALLATGCKVWGWAGGRPGLGSGRHRPPPALTLGGFGSVLLLPAAAPGAPGTSTPGHVSAPKPAAAAHPKVPGDLGGPEPQVRTSFRP